MDLENYQGQIDQLLSLRYEPDFDELFDRVMFGESNNSKFLLKMELKRLATPCRRLIDLRGKVDAECEEYQHEQQLHFLDPLGIKTFEKSLKLYRGQYTIGVYEAVLNTENHFSVLNKKKLPADIIFTGDDEEQAKDVYRSLQVDKLSFSRYQGRVAERMHFAIQVQAQLDYLDVIDATTSDISISGLRLRISASQHIKNGAEVGITFTGLQNEYANPELRTPVYYSVVAQETKDNILWLRLARTKTINPFDVFIQDFIHSNKYKYKLNLDNLIKEVKTRAYEAYYLPKMQGLPLYINQAPEFKMVLSNQVNRDILEYWRDESGQDCLSFLISQTRIKKLLRQHNLVKETLLYSFTHTTDGKIHFLSASKDELQESGLKTLFLAFGARKPNWRVYKLQIKATELDIKQLPDVCQTALEKSEAIAYLGLLQDITHDFKQSSYQALPCKLTEANQLNRFVHYGPGDPIEQIPLKFIQQRYEKRYLYKSPVEVLVGNTNLTGGIEDFSTMGLKVLLDKTAQIKHGQVLELSLPKLQKLTKNLTLSQLKYEVINSNKAKTILHLKAVKAKQHAATAFFQLLIESNPGKLKEASEPKLNPGLDTALKALYCQQFLGAGVFISRFHGRYDADKLAMQPQLNRLAPLFSALSNSQQHYNLYPILQNGFKELLISNQLKRPLAQEIDLKTELYIHLDRHQEVHTRLLKEFMDDSERKSFISQALQSGYFFSISYKLNRIGKPDTQTFSSELDYIAQYAIHKAKILEDEIWTVAGLAELIDTTQETLFRFGLRDPMQ